MTGKEKIYPNPPIPPQLIEAINNNQFAIFFGAGTSMMIGCSSWERMAEKLIERCFTTPKKDDSRSTCITYKEQEALLKMKDPKKIITICQYILHKNGSEKEFFNQIQDCLIPNQDLLDKQNIYNELDGLRGLFITTNIDAHFDKKFHPSRILIHKEDFDPSTLDESKLYHIHGSISDWSTVVITVKDYFERYNDEKFKIFLQKIFDEKTILFIGYGLNEFEVLDFLITKSGIPVSKEPKHFILLPYYRGEDNILEFEEQYFRQMGISVIPYMKDEKGYGQLFDVIKKWNQEIILQSRFLHATHEELKNAANNYTPSVEGKIFQLITNDKTLEFEFFRQLSKTENPFPWVIPLKNSGYFNPKNNPSTTEGFGSYWIIMAVLENVAKLNSEKPSEEITGEIIQIIDSIIEYRDENNNRIENIFTDRHVVRIIFLLPFDSINANHLDFINTCLHSYHDRILIAGEIGDTIIPRLLAHNNKSLLLKILEILLDFEKSKKPTFEKYPSVLGEYYLQVVMEKYTIKILTTCGIECIDVAIRKIESVVREDPSQFHEVWLPSITEKSDVKERYDTQIIHFIWIGFKLLGPTQIRDHVSELLKKEHSIFKRLAISAINEYYPELNDLFWSIEHNPLNEFHVKHELYELLKQHCNKFSDQQIKKVIEWIETQTYHEDKISDDPLVQGKYLAYHKKEWLSALLPKGDPQVEDLFAKYQSINPAELKHPGRSFVIEHFSGLPSPIPKEDLLNKTNVEIVQYLNNFQGDEYGPEISRHSLCDIFRVCIIENPQKFLQDLDPFLNLNRLYQYELLIGLSEAWRKENNFKWAGIFKFINSILESEEFWTEVYNEGESNYRNWIISRIANLIEEGTVKDSHLFELHLLPEAEKILLLLARRAESDLFTGGDLVNSVLNSNKGSIYSAIVNYSLCYGRHYRKDSDIRWPESIKKEFEQRLDPSVEPSVEFSVTLGKYLPYLCYLDKEWVRRNINRIFPKDNEIHWNAAFTAYLFYSKIFKNIYSMLKANGHYSRAINTEFKDPHINENLVRHICIVYIEDIEKTDDGQSLISQLLFSWNFTQIIELIHFLKWYGQKVTPEKRQMVLPLWEIIFSKIVSDEKNPDNIRLLSGLNDWICLIDDLSDEICERLKVSVKYIRSHDFGFVEELIRHSDKKPKCAGEIFLNMIEAGHFFDYQQELIKKFVTILYEKGERKIADAICNQYLRVGFEFLIPIYEQNQNP
ncbi:MAG: SIR2 family protein [Methanoregula sp.]|nr:MAG: SIR2 family protein [Methanoregula sp.]